MDIPTDPSALLKEVSDKLKEEQEKAGLGNADALVKKLDEIKTKAQEGPGDVTDKLKEGFQSFMDKINEIIENPGAMGGGAMAACAACAAKQICAKLKVLKDEAEEIFKCITDLTSKLAEPFGNLGKVLGEVMDTLAETMKKLMGMPDEFQGLSGNVASAEDLVKVDLTDIKKALDISALSSTFESLSGVKETFGPIMQEVGDALEKFADFLSGAPDKVRKAFKTPLTCCMKPPGMKELLDKLDIVQAIDFKPLLDVLSKTKESVGKMDVEALKKPLEDFSSSASGPIGNLENAQSAAKGASALSGAVGSLGGMFGQ